jgi:hypothetical protein
MERSCLHKTELLVLILLLGGCAAEHVVKATQASAANTDRSEGNDTNIKQNQGFFLRQIFNKYGDHGVITFEVKNSSDYILGAYTLDV